MSVPLSARTDPRRDAGRTHCLESFSRVIGLFALRDTEVSEFVRSLEGFSLAVDGSVRRVWQRPTQNRLDMITSYMLPAVDEYLRGSGKLPASCNMLLANEEILDGIGDMATRVRTDFSHPADPQRNMQLKLRLRMASLEVYIFATSIVAVVAEVRVLGVRDDVAGADERPVTVDDIIAVNYSLKSMMPYQAPWLVAQRCTLSVPGLSPEHDDWSVVSGRRKAGGTGGRNHGLMLADWIPLLLGKGQPAFEPLNERAFRVQTYVHLPGDLPIEDHAESFYRLRRVVKHSYSAAPQDSRIDGVHDVHRPFGNRLDGYTLEGSAVLLLEDGNPFNPKVGERVRTAHFAQYLLALHQRAALLRLALKAGTLPLLKDWSSDDEESSRVLARAKALRHEAADFNLHHRFSQVTMSTPHAAGYDMATRALYVPELLREVRDEVRELDEILRIEAAHREDERRERQRRLEERQRETAFRADRAKELRLTRLVLVLAVPTLLFSYFGANVPPYAENMGRFRDWRYYLTPEVAVPVVTAVILWCVLWWISGRSAHARHSPSVPSDAATDNGSG